LTSFAVSPDGGFTISDGQSSPAWLVWVYRPHVADKILNHQAGTISGVAAVYQRHDFLLERKEALDRWGAHVERILQTFK